MLSTSSQTLDALEPGDCATILALDAGQQGLYHRLAALGLRAGKTVHLIRRARFGGPFHIRVGTTDLMLRVPDARRIRVRKTSA
ncbi:MAG TPA: FeoA family protein [Burkholderiales bacterium]|nr:FeoA family protein [Burkholderiales bacterium]